MRFLKRAGIAFALLFAGGGGWLAYQFGHPAPPPAALQLPPTTLASDALRAQFFGTTTLLLRDGRNAVMIDALLSRPAIRDVLLGKIGPDRARSAGALARGKVDRIDLLLVTHSHYDHSLDAAAIARRTGATVVGSPSTREVAIGGGVAASGVRIVSGGEMFDAGDFHVTVFRSRHSPGDRVPGTITAPVHPPAKAADYKNGGTFAYLVEHRGLRILVHASANHVPGMYRGVRADAIFLAIGGLGAQSDAFVERYWRETVEATGAQLVIPTHWDDFLQPLDGPFEPLPRLLDDVPAAMAKIGTLARRDGIAIRTMPPIAAVDIAAAIPRR